MLVKKKSNMINISMQSAIVTGSIISLVFGIVMSYIMAYIIVDGLEFGNGKINIFEFGSFLIPICFVVFEMSIMTFIIGISKSKKK